MGAKTIRKAGKDDMVLCEVCSQEFDHEAYYPKKALRVKEPEFFLDADQEKRVLCPRGHEIKDATVPA